MFGFCGGYNGRKEWFQSYNALTGASTVECWLSTFLCGERVLLHQVGKLSYIVIISLVCYISSYLEYSLVYAK